MIKYFLIFAALGLIGIGYFIGINDIAGQISCVIISSFGILAAFVGYKLDEHNDR